MKSFTGDIYPHIDLVVSGRDGNLKNEYRVKPGGDPGLIELKYEGAKSLALNERGQLEATTEFGSLFEDIPVSYQKIDGQKRAVEARYEIQGGGHGQNRRR